MPSAYTPRLHSGAAIPSVNPTARSQSYPMMAYSQPTHLPLLAPMSLPHHSCHPLHLHGFAHPLACPPNLVTFDGTPSRLSNSMLLYAQGPTCHHFSQRGGLLWAVPFSGSLAQTNLQTATSPLGPTTPTASMAGLLLSAIPALSSPVGTVSRTVLPPRVARHTGVAYISIS